MGIKFHFTCPNCDHQAVVGGGVHGGLSWETYRKTIHCLDCRELYDVSCSGREVRPARKPTWGERLRLRLLPPPPLCPKNKAHRWEDWREPYPCPRCDGQMRQGPVERIWD